MTLTGILKSLGRCLTSARYKVDGDSMLPTLQGSQYVLARPISDPQQGPISRGEIVVLRHPVHNNRIYIKRIVGLPNESILLKDGVTYIDDQVLDEPYLPDNTHQPRQGEWWNGPQEYFLMGDNRRDSEDSRAFGPVSRDLLLGRVWLRYWPPTVWGKIR